MKHIRTTLNGISTSLQTSVSQPLILAIFVGHRQQNRSKSPESKMEVLVVLVFKVPQLKLIPLRIDRNGSFASFSQHLTCFSLRRRIVFSWTSMSLVRLYGIHLLQSSLYSFGYMEVDLVLPLSFVIM